MSENDERSDAGPSAVGVRRPATIRDVAAHAGVSKSVVSRVLRDEPNVSEERRARVRDAMAELDYRPNTMARGLSQSRSGTIGVVINDLRNPWYVSLIEGLATTLDAVDIAPILVDSRLDHQVGRNTVETLLSRQVDGLVVVGTTDARVDVERAALSIPVVLAGTLEPDLPTVDIAVDDDLAGATMATEHLLRLGHRRLAHIQGPGAVGALRRKGFEDTLAAAGIAAENMMVEYGGTREEGGYAAAERLLDAATPPTAILAYNDMTSLGVMSAADDRGLSIPGDLSLIGYDNTQLASLRHISLTSVDNGNFTVGTQAAKFLIQRMDRLRAPQRIYRHTPTLVVRRTTSAPRERD
ncbi:LacI family DNA-binding transcriptional regulator [Gordonia rhizosphera]|uniref:Putative LacI family transcriptional regulator n=1 Tax=Gordonia rhizosphera NBRC 16068 TaxID=1108045 RepID=K6WCH7_9ACTN|nr:LacI family DNA-binding transcriptional regulator [Gordonia rhizosphera]GAB91436.1 putative LacI family transcriptional regulator [Gordonia rhizosphera NBRC 16068]